MYDRNETPRISRCPVHLAAGVTTIALLFLSMACSSSTDEVAVAEIAIAASVSDVTQACVSHDVDQLIALSTDALGDDLTQNVVFDDAVESASVGNQVIEVTAAKATVSVRIDAVIGGETVEVTQVWDYVPGDDEWLLDTVLNCAWA